MMVAILRTFAVGLSILFGSLELVVPGQSQTNALPDRCAVPFTALAGTSTEWIHDLTTLPRVQKASRHWHQIVDRAVKARSKDNSARTPDKSSGQPLSATTLTIRPGFQPYFLQSPTQLNINGREVDCPSIRSLTRQGNVNLALSDSSSLYASFPDRIDVVIERTRVLIAAGQFGQAFDVIVPHAGDGAMEETNLFACIASVRAGIILPGEREYCVNFLKSGDTEGELDSYFASLPNTARETEILAWTALGAEYYGHGNQTEAYYYFRQALKLDQSNPYVAVGCGALDYMHMNMTSAEQQNWKRTWLQPLLHAALPRATGLIRERLIEEGALIP
jgi:hypothetical protein